MKTFWSIKESKDKKDMNWAQAKWNFPKLKPNKDNDKDGVKNQFDCKPLNKKKQDDSKWKEQMIEDFHTVGDLKRFVEEKENKE